MFRNIAIAVGVILKSEHRENIGSKVMADNANKYNKASNFRYNYKLFVSHFPCRGNFTTGC